MTLSFGAGPFQDGSMLVRLLSLFLTLPIIELIPLSRPLMMFLPAFSSQLPAPEKMFLMALGMSRNTVMNAPLTSPRMA